MRKLFSFTIMLFVFFGLWIALEDAASIDTKKIPQLEFDLPIAAEQDTQSPRFTVNNIALGDSKSEIEKRFGPPLRSTLNEYGLWWHTYHQNYENFFMVTYDTRDTVAALYTNHELIDSSFGISHGASKREVRQALGEPLQSIQKGMIQYQFQEDRHFDLYKLDSAYVTIFYDVHSQNTITGIQLVAEEIEKEKDEYFVTPTELLKEGFELQLFDLTNATRVFYDLPILHLDEQASMTARKHSVDMATHQYFNHTNLKGQSPFERMEEDNIFFAIAGENLATGQYSSIFAHEGLMNSLGHRENILHPDFEHIGIGVAFDQKAQPYYTQNFFAK